VSERPVNISGAIAAMPGTEPALYNTLLRAGGVNWERDGILGHVQLYTKHSANIP
jgi:hypothetical protein